MNKEAQQRRVLSHLLENGSCTAVELTAEYGIGSPRKRLSEVSRMPMLELLGLRMKKTWEKGFNRYGDHVRYIRYSLEEIENDKA